MRISNSRVIALALAVALLVGLVSSPALGGPSFKKRIRKEVSKQLRDKVGPPGSQGIQGPQGPQGIQGSPGAPGAPGAATGPAGGALAGNYPNPTLDVSGGTDGPTACANGQEVSAISTLAVITCTAGVYSDDFENVAAGPTAFPALSPLGRDNSALGEGALASNVDGDENSAVGMNALFSNTDGNSNSAVGMNALFSNTGSSNSALGTGALGSNTVGGGNSALGEGALGSNTTGGDNTALGVVAQAGSTGSGNITIGALAGGNLTTGDDNIAIANPGVAGESSTTRIGDADQTRAFIAGISGVTTGAAAIPVLIDSNGQLGTASSSRRFKTEIEPLGGADPLLALEPVSFRYRESPSELHYGLIAEQVEKVMPTLVAYGRDGLPETVQYQELPALLLAKIQDQQRTIDDLLVRVKRLEARPAD